MRPSALSTQHLALKAPRAFTMAELLIVIALIVLLLGLAVPAFNLLSGGKSIEGATNQVSAALGRARAEAIGLQKVTGLMFFVDPRTQRRSVAIVQEVDHPAATGIDVWLDIVDDNDFLPLPAGVGAQVIDDCTLNGTAPNQTRADDGYIGFNHNGASSGSTTGTRAASGPNNTSTAYGGVILFDGAGQMTSLAYGFRCAVQPPAGGQPVLSKLGQLLQPA